MGKAWPHLQKYWRLAVVLLVLVVVVAGIGCSDGGGSSGGSCPSGYDFYVGGNCPDGCCPSGKWGACQGSNFVCI